MDFSIKATFTKKHMEYYVEKDKSEFVFIDNNCVLFIGRRYGVKKGKIVTINQ